MLINEVCLMSESKYVYTEDRKESKFTRFYKELLALLSKYDYIGMQIGHYDLFKEINKMKTYHQNKGKGG